MLGNLPRVRVDPAPFRPQQISSNMHERALQLELKRRACVRLRQVIQLKIQQRRTREEFVNHGIMPPLKSSAAFHEQTQSLEQASTKDYLKQKFRNQPKQSELIRMRILAGAPAVTPLQAKQLQLKRARLADDLNNTQFTKALCDTLSCHADSDDSLSPEQSGRQPLSLGPLAFTTETPTRSTIPSPSQLTSGTKASTPRIGASSQNKPKPNTDRSAQRHKKPMDNEPKIKKLKYHQYIPPDKKGEKEPPPHLDTAYSKILQQQQLFLQLQILREQQHNNNCLRILSVPPSLQKDQLDEMKVADLKSELKLRSLPVSGAKNDLIQRLRAYEELSGGSDTASSLTAGGAAGPGAKGAAAFSSQATPSRSNQELIASSGIISLLPTDITEVSQCSTPAPCQFFLKPACLQTHSYPVLSPALTSTNAPLLQTVDKDKMLREKDKQIEELTRMLRQKQQLVEALKMQLEHGRTGANAPDPVVLVKIKQEPIDETSVALSCGNPPFPLSPLAVSCKMDVNKFTVKQERTEAEEVVSEKTLKLRDNMKLPQLLSQEVQERIVQQMKPKHAYTKEQQHISLQCSNLQVAQQQAIKKLLLRQQHLQTLVNQQNLQRRCQQRKQKSPKQQHSQERNDRPKGHLQRKHEHFLKHILSPVKQTFNQKPLSKAPKPVKLQINLKKRQVLIQKNPQMQQLSAQVTKGNSNKQPGPVPPLQLDLISLDKSDSAPNPVTDSNGNHFLIALTRHATTKQRTNAPEATNGITQQDVGSRLDVLFSPLSPASVEKAPSSPDKDTECEEDFMDTLLQTGETKTTSKPAPDPFLDSLCPHSVASSAPPLSPLQLLQSPPTPPGHNTAQKAVKLQSHLESRVDTTEGKPHNSHGIGRLEDFLESTTGKPLLGVEPGGLLALIDELHSQMLCTPSILERPPSPLDSFDTSAAGKWGLNINNWLDLTIGRDASEESEVPLSPPTPCGIFSTDCLESCMIL